MRGVGIAKLVKEEWKPYFTDRPTRRDERWDGVPGAIRGCVCYLGINGWAAAAGCRLRMTEGAASGIEPRAKAGAGFNGA
jgi:hypothetical protein